MNTIFAVEKQNIYPYITLIDNNWIKKEDIMSEEDIQEKGYDQYDDLYSKKRGYEIFNYLEWRNNIYLQYYKGSDFFSVIYNKDKNECELYKHFANDLLFTQGKFTSRFLYANSKFAYDILYPDGMTYFVENVKSGNLVLSPDIDKREELMNLNDEQIVIFEYEFK